MAGMTYFQGLSFPLFGMNRRADNKTDAFPLFYGLQYVHSGHVYLSVNGGATHSLKGPVVFLTSPDAVFSYGSPPGRTREQYFVCFEGERVKSFLKKGLFIPAWRQEVPYIRPASPESFLGEMLELIRNLQNEGSHDSAVAKLEYLLLQLHDEGKNDVYSGFHHARLERLTQEIMCAPEKEWDFAKEAAEMNITQKHFRRLFHQNCGTPPRQFVLRQRILKAGTMLIMTSDSIKSIAFDCGFNNEFYFSRIFKKYMNMSPELYRNRHPYRSTE